MKESVIFGCRRRRGCSTFGFLSLLLRDQILSWRCQPFESVNAVMSRSLFATRTVKCTKLLYHSQIYPNRDYCVENPITLQFSCSSNQGTAFACDSKSAESVETMSNPWSLPSTTVRTLLTPAACNFRCIARDSSVLTARSAPP